MSGSLEEVGGYWVIEGRLGAGPHPCPDAGNHSNHGAQNLIRDDFDLLVDLTQAGEPGIDSYSVSGGVAGIEVTYRRFGIPDMQVPSVNKMADILDLLDSGMEDGRKIYLHCRAGLGRTGTVVACFLARTGMTGEQALSRLAEMRSQAGRSGDSPETEAQRRFVLAWTELDPAFAE
ncbi:MAG: fused DSP-PTPase phosphatase/NAD kinase-like protein [Anaerolineales bacterium]